MTLTARLAVKVEADTDVTENTVTATAAETSGLEYQ